MSNNRFLSVCGDSSDFEVYDYGNPHRRVVRREEVNFQRQPTRPTEFYGNYGQRQYYSGNVEAQGGFNNNLSNGRSGVSPNTNNLSYRNVFQQFYPRPTGFRPNTVISKTLYRNNKFISSSRSRNPKGRTSKFSVLIGGIGSVPKKKSRPSQPFHVVCAVNVDSDGDRVMMDKEEDRPGPWSAPMAYDNNHQYVGPSRGARMTRGMSNPAVQKQCRDDPMFAWNVKNFMDNRANFSKRVEFTETSSDNRDFYFYDLENVICDIEDKIQERLNPRLVNQVTKRSKLFVRCQMNTFQLLHSKLSNSVKPTKFWDEKKLTMPYGVNKMVSKTVVMEWTGNKFPKLKNDYWWLRQQYDGAGSLYREMVTRFKLTYLIDLRRIIIEFSYKIFKWSGTGWNLVRRSCGAKISRKTAGHKKKWKIVPIEEGKPFVLVKLPD